MVRRKRSTFAGKVRAITKRLEGKRGPVKYAEKDRRYSHVEAQRSARRIAGRIASRER